MDNHVITSMLYHRVLSSVANRKHLCQLNSVDQDKKLAMPAFQDSIRQPSHIEVRSLNSNSFWAIHCLISSVTSSFTFVQVLPVPSNFRFSYLSPTVISRKPILKPGPPGISGSPGSPRQCLAPFLPSRTSNLWLGLPPSDHPPPKKNLWFGFLWKSSIPTPNFQMFYDLHHCPVGE